jgi:hypothetical protein
MYSMHKFGVVMHLLEVKTGWETQGLRKEARRSLQQGQRLEQQQQRPQLMHNSGIFESTGFTYVGCPHEHGF